LFYVFLAAGLAWLLYHRIKHNPGAFSAKNFGKSFSTMGLLGLALIAFIAVLVMLLRG